MHFKILIPLLVTLLTACQTSNIGNEDSPYYTVPVGSRVILNRPLTIPPDRVGVLIQDGKTVPYGQVRTYYPHCKFELRHLASTPRTVAPDELIVTRVTRELAHGVDAGSLQYADVTMARGVRKVSDGFDTPSIRAFATYMYLGSDRQPDIFRLSCGVWGYPHEDQHVSINEIRRTLGEITTLQLAEPRK